METGVGRGHLLQLREPSSAGGLSIACPAWFSSILSGLQAVEMTATAVRQNKAPIIGAADGVQGDSHNGERKTETAYHEAVTVTTKQPTATMQLMELNRLRVRPQLCSY